MSDIIREVLTFDALAHAEEITGKSYKDDNTTESLGLLGHLIHVQRKREILEANNDTTFSTETNRYLGIMEELGFSIVYQEDFTRSGVHCNNNGVPYVDTLYIMYSHGCLLKFDTYWNKKSINGGNLYFNWKPHNQYRKNLWKNMPPHCSGGFKEVDGIWINAGYLDCREGMRYSLGILRANGTFIEPWVAEHFVQLTTSEDYDKNSNYGDYSKSDAATARRWSGLPQEIREKFPAALCGIH